MPPIARRSSGIARPRGAVIEEPGTAPKVQILHGFDAVRMIQQRHCDVHCRMNRKSQTIAAMRD